MIFGGGAGKKGEEIERREAGRLEGWRNPAATSRWNCN